MNETGAVIESPVRQLQAAIGNFLQERLQPKLDEIKRKEEKLEEDEADELRQLGHKRQQLLDAYQPETWIADAARRVVQIQQVTHALKFTHPDAKGTCLNTPGNPDAGHLAVGTHTICEQHEPDVVGNAAALDVYKFLRLEVNGKTFLKRAIEGDPSLQSAFSADAKQAQSWMAAFAHITFSEGDLAAHKLSKQVYWPVVDGVYHLLAPLFPTSLVHVIWKTVREDRFSESAKAARDARKAGKSHHEGYREYPDLVVQKFGGTKPQNISQLNSERHGDNYLFPSYPPTWISERVRPPLRVKSVFDGWFGRRKRVRELTRILRDFLLNVRAVNNVRIRNKRAELVGHIRDELLQFAAELHELPGGWSLHEDCRLNPDEQCWLDPWRAEKDEAFASARGQANWQDAVCKRFANWLNARLTIPRTSLPMGEAEAREWRSVLDEELGMIRMEIDIND